MSNLTTVTVTAGVPTAGTGTVSTLDNIMALGTPIKDGVAATMATVKAASTAPVAGDTAVVVAISPNSVNANVNAGAPTTETGSATGTQSIVAGSASSVTVLAANSARLGATVYNDSTAILYLLLKTGGTASTTVYTVQIAANGYYEVPFRFQGALIGIWASAAGNARVTEMT